MIEVFDKQKINLLTYCLHNLVRGCWAVQSVGELLAVPDEELGVGGYGSHRVKVDVLLNLTGHQILMRFRMSWIHESHPVAFGQIKTVNVVRELIFFVHLKKMLQNYENWFNFIQKNTKKKKIALICVIFHLPPSFLVWKCKEWLLSDRSCPYLYLL